MRYLPLIAVLLAFHLGRETGARDAEDSSEPKFIDQIRTNHIQIGTGPDAVEIFTSGGIRCRTIDVHGESNERVRIDSKGMGVWAVRGPKGKRAPVEAKYGVEKASYRVVPLNEPLPGSGK